MTGQPARLTGRLARLTGRIVAQSECITGQAGGLTGRVVAGQVARVATLTGSASGQTGPVEGLPVEGRRRGRALRGTERLQQFFEDEVGKRWWSPLGFTGGARGPADPHRIRLLAQLVRARSGAVGPPVGRRPDERAVTAEGDAPPAVLLEEMVGAAQTDQVALVGGSFRERDDMVEVGARRGCMASGEPAGLVSGPDPAPQSRSRAVAKRIMDECAVSLEAREPDHYGRIGQN